MLDTNMKTQLGSYLALLARPVELVASLDDSANAVAMRALLGDLAALSDKLVIRYDGTNPRVPSFSLGPLGEPARIHFAGLPLGHEFTSLALALLHNGGHPPKVSTAQIERIKALPGPLAFETFVSLECHNCPDVVQALNLMATLNPDISNVMIDGAMFADEVTARNVLAVPMIWCNGEHFGQGRSSLDEILARLDSADSATRQARADALSARAPYDVLIVGAGPAGASAAIYSARKSLRTALVGERFGGQVADTLGIDNLISVAHTEGPALAASLEAHVRQHNVDLIVPQRVAQLRPATQPGGLHQVLLGNEARLSARSVILATGARWRELGVPGEQQYRGRGVAYCPHCDGPLFKGKDIAVVGGGNSGVEAAIDLAGVARHVTLLEFDTRLRADAVLQDTLRTLANVTVIVNARTAQLDGDGQRLTGLRYEDRTTGTVHELALAGVFVQIGLLPNTDFAQAAVTLTRFREIEVDAKGQTSVPGIFAAGDATTVPYKQIVISMGEGAKAALSAFDYLIRHSQPVS